MLFKEYFIPKPTQIIFVSDLYVEDYVGGAELTTEALIKSAPESTKIFKLHSESLTESLVAANKDKVWVLCNWTRCPSEGIIALVNQQCKYFVVEYDYKYCSYRSKHLHLLETKQECQCHKARQGQFVAQLYRRAQHVFFMSVDQHKEYFGLLPILLFSNNSSVLSSVWTKEDLDMLRALKASRMADNGKWMVLSGGSWIKAQEATEALCKAKGLSYDLVGNLPYSDFIQKMSQYRGLIFHPAGFDTCPRLVVEAKLLGLELDLGDNVQHRAETWFTGSVENAEAYLSAAPERFWGIVK